MDNRPFGTCFFEQYAQITLATFLGGEMTTLVNRDRPDLQSPDGARLAIKQGDIPECLILESFRTFELVQRLICVQGSVYVVKKQLTHAHSGNI